MNPFLQPLRLFQAAGLTAALALAITLPACSGEKRSLSGGTNTLRYALQTVPTSLDPAKVEDGDTIDLLQQVFEGLVRWDENNEIQPNLAEKWEISPDGKVYTFHLKPGVKFHNGREMSAKDVEFSMTRSLRKETVSPVAMTYLNDIVGAAELNTGTAQTLAGLKVVDDKTVEVTLVGPRPYFLGKLTYPTGFVVNREAIEANGGKVDEKSMIGTGPFKLTEYQSGSLVKLAANDAYHGGRPKLDGIERPIQVDPVTRQTAYENGSLHYTDVQRGDIARVQGDPKLSSQLKQLKRANIYYLALNQNAFAPFKDKRVRQAFAHAINKDELIRVALSGAAEKANGILPPGIPGHDAAYQGLPYDPAKAKQLLAQAGYPGGKGFPKLTITYRQGYQFLADAVQALRGDLKQNLGVEVDTKQLEWAQFLRERNNKTMPCYHLRWAADYLDPQNFLSLMLHSKAPENTIGFSNPRFDALCDQADSEQDPEKRMALYRQAQAIAIEEVAWVTLYHLPDVELQKPEMGGIRDMLLGHLPHTTTTLSGK